jgi:hypothetical protein
VKIGGDLMGGGGEASGAISSFNPVTTLSVGGSLAGGDGKDSGAISLFQNTKTLTVGGDLIGGAGMNSGAITNFGDLSSLTVGRSWITGAGANSGRIAVTNDLGAFTICGEIIGTAAVPAKLTVGDTSSPANGADLVLGKFSVKRGVQFARILAGYEISLAGTNADAQIGAVTIGGDWIASSIVAGVQDDATAALNAFFGDADDTKITGGDAAINSKIASVVIKGQALGTAAGGDHFGIVAQEIGALSVGAVKFALTPGAANDDLTATSTLLRIGATGDFRVHEVAL